MEITRKGEERKYYVNKNKYRIMILSERGKIIIDRNSTNYSNKRDWLERRSKILSKNKKLYFIGFKHNPQIRSPID